MGAEGNRLRNSLSKVEDKMAHLQAEQEVGLKYQQGLLKKAQGDLGKVNAQIDSLTKEFMPYVDGDATDETKFFSLKDDYDSLIVLRGDLEATIVLAEETIAEAQLGMSSPTLPNTGKSFGEV